MADAWRNWAGDQECRPVRIVAPRDREELSAVVVEAAAAEGKASVFGAGHSFTGTALTDAVAIDVSALSGIVEADPSSGLVEVGAGTVLADLNRELDRLGLAMENLGDIDRQTVAGAISTGTHGTGVRLPNLSAQVEAVELVTASGEVRRIGGAEPELLRAARIGLGALGAITAVTLRCVPAFALRRVDAPRPREQVLDDFERQAAAHDHFELFTFPYADSALVIERNRIEEAPPPPRRARAARFNEVVLENWALGALAATGKRFPAAIPALSRLAGRLASGGSRTEASHRIFASERRVRFTEMEYGVPREHGPEAVRRTIEWVRRNRYPVFFPIEVRVAAGDDALLSPSHERDTAYIAVHQYRGMEWRPYFEAVEEIMREYGGRPHWGKRHFQTAATLAPLFPGWERFQAARDELDPGRVFTNEYAERVLGP
jgi:L-gulono-1,4-lactone dehydrogenase